MATMIVKDGLPTNHQLVKNDTDGWSAWVWSFVSREELKAPPLVEKTVQALTPDDFEIIEPEVVVKMDPGFLGRISEPTKLEEDEIAIRKELAPFFDRPEEITQEDVQMYVEELNKTYPEYAIDPNKPLLDEIRRTKMAMIERGEEGYKRGVNWYAFFSKDAMNTMYKIAIYQKDRAGFAEDIDYQQRMLSSFKFFY